MKTYKEIKLWTKTFLESIWGVVAMCCVAMIFWFLGLPKAGVISMAIFVSLTFLLCDDIKLLFASFFYVPYFSIDIFSVGEIIFFLIIIAIVLTTIIYFFIKHRHVKVKKGNLFWGLMIADLAFLLGGIVGHFNIKNFAIILGLNIAIYILYFLAINHTKNLISYLMLSFVVVGICLVLQHTSLILKSGNILECITGRQLIFLGEVSINTVALYYALGVIGGFYLFKKAQKHKWLYCVLSVVMIIFMLLTYCRGVIFTSGLVIFTLCIIAIAKSPNKKKLSIICSSILAVTIALIFAIPSSREIALRFLARGTAPNGRDKLWTWCVEQFKSSPVFGVGFVSNECPPSLSINLVMAHNTILQWFTSLGIVGTCMMIPFYYEKYKIFFGKYNFEKIVGVCALLCIELDGIVGATSTMFFFIFAIAIVLVGAVENENKSCPGKIATEIILNEEIENKNLEGENNESRDCCVNIKKPSEL